MDAIIDIGTFTGDIVDMANIAIYLQDDNTADIANTTIYLQNDGNTQFYTLWQKEVIGLLKKGVFKIIKLCNMLKGVKLFNLQFINKIKNKGTNKAFKKLQLIIQAYNNLEKELVLTQSLII